MSATAVPLPLPGPERRGHDHLRRLRHALALLGDEVDRLERWGRALHECLARGGRLLVAGNGGSAAHAQHLAAELVGRYHHERRAYSALALAGDAATTTALANDYGVEEVFARQVRAHGRPGDVFLALSTSGASPNVVRAAYVADELGLAVWALTGEGPNPLEQGPCEALCVGSDHTATIQEVHQVAIHLLCEAFDQSAGCGS